MHNALIFKQNQKHPRHPPQRATPMPNRCNFIVDFVDIFLSLNAERNFRMPQKMTSEVATPTNQLNWYTLNMAWVTID